MVPPATPGIGAITIEGRVDYGRGEKLFMCSFQGDGVYPTGGTAGADVTKALRDAIALEAFLAADSVVRGPEAVTIKDAISGDCGRYEAYWVDGKLKVLNGGSATRAEVLNGADLGGDTFNVAFICD